jgi:hypothetical protein
MTSWATRIRSRSDEEADVRFSVHSFVQSELHEILAGCENVGSPPVAAEIGPIWIYWAQGADAMPPIVSACLRQLRRTNAGSAICVLDDRTISDHVEVPSIVLERTFENKTHVSDVFRVHLLSEYGGIWIDATCFCTDALHGFVGPLLTSGFLAYSRNDDDPFMLSSWFMAARRHHIIPTALRGALNAYWTRHSSQIHYFLLHFLFEALYNLCAPFRQQWELTPKLSAYDAHRLQLTLLEPFDRAAWRDLLSLSAVHKLTYKLLEPPLDRDTFYNHIVAL